MAVFLSRVSQQYAARQNPYVVTATIPDGTVVNAVKVSLTRESWPVGSVGSVALTYPDGSISGFPLDGGDLLERDGVTIAPLSSVQFTNAGQPFPVGTYTLAFTVLQTATTAVTVERF